MKKTASNSFAVEDISLHGQMLSEYYIARLRALREQRVKARAGIRTAAGVLKLRAEVRRRLRCCLGPLPTTRPPLNIRLTGKTVCRHFVIEKLVYDSRPGLPVTANLYIPRNGSGPFPVVLGTCGHANDGKYCDTYQKFAQGLAVKGFMTLLYDPIGQGERSQYLEKRPWPYPAACAAQHTMLGNAMRLTGDFFGAWRVWDGIRSLDVLLGRPEADRRYVGVTGNSGGGTLSSYLNAVDDRITMAAPSCFVTTCLHNLENQNLADQEQNPPGFLAAGLDMADFFVAQIPRPVVLLGQKNDFFDRRGIEETYAELARLYALMGKPGNIRLSIGSGDHGYHRDNREPMYSFFQEFADRPIDAVEPALRPLQPARLQCTSKGQTLLEPGMRAVNVITAENASELRVRRKPLPDSKMADLLVELLRLPARRCPPVFRQLPCANPQKDKRLFHYMRFVLETEESIQAHLHMFDAGMKYYYFPRAKSAVMVVAHSTSIGEFMEWQPFPRAGRMFFLDARGIGVTRPLRAARKDAYHFMGGEYYYASQAQMLDTPLIGGRTHDVLSALDHLTAHGYEEVHLTGRGLGTLPVIFAACIHPVVKTVSLVNPLISFEELTQAPYYQWPLSVMPPAILQHLDLPDCYRWLNSTKKLSLINPWNNIMKVWPRNRLAGHLDKLGLSGIKTYDRFSERFWRCR